MNLQKIKTLVFPKGFTLVELIVVITILAILGTIGFLSIGGYSSKARDSARIGDVAQISKSLDLSIVTAGDYPAPDNAFSVTYSGGVIWNQGTIGNNVLQVMKSSIAGGGLNKKPTDPLTNKEYTYSELAEGKAYQIKVDYEGDLAQTAIDASLIDSASAAPGNPTIAYIRGNFGGLTAKTTTGSTVFILAIPSIMSNTGTVGVPIEIRGTTALSGALLFHGQNLKGATTYNPNVVVFTGTIVDTNKLGLPSTTTEITNMMTLLQSTYSGSNVRASQSVSSLITMNTGALVDLWKTAVIVQLGGGAVNTEGGATNGTCGTANGGTGAVAPTTNLCSLGMLSGSVIGSSAPWTWTCSGTNGGSSANCSTEVPLYTFTNHAFTSCGTSGAYGPALSTCQSSYNGAEVNAWKNTYLTMSVNGIQEWTVPSSGTYRVESRGAQGGNFAGSSYMGGNGAIIRGDVVLLKGEKIKILVGQSGGNSYGGGGGGTFVTKYDNTPLVIAGGGNTLSAWYSTAIHATTSTSGLSCSNGSVAGGSGGSGGNGGGTNSVGGGAGLTGNGGTSSCASFTIAYSFTNGGIGGLTCNGAGGFGGGSGSDGCCNGASGAGGGYSGGGGCNTSSVSGGGGGSYNAGSNQSNSVGNTGNGSVTITKL